MGRHLLVIDPGLDAMGCAVFELEGCNPREPEKALRWVETVRTSATEEIATRLDTLAQAAFVLRARFECGSALIELPEFTGTYNRNRGAVGRDGMAAGMAKLHLSIGYIAGALSGEMAIELVPALRTRKDRKQEIAKLIVAAASQLRLVKPRAVTPSADALDAVALGASQLARFVA